MLHWERRHANGKRRREKRSSTKGAAERISNLSNLFHTPKTISISKENVLAVRPRFCPSEKMHERKKGTPLLFRSLEQKVLVQEVLPMPPLVPHPVYADYVE